MKRCEKFPIKKFTFYENNFHKLILNIQIQFDKEYISGVWYSDGTPFKSTTYFINCFKILQR